MAVGESGTTETLVRKGRLSLEPRSGGKQAGKTVEVAADGLNRAKVFLADAAAPLHPVIATANGAQGQFLATINAEGKTMEFTSPGDFQKAQSQVVELLVHKPDRFAAEWRPLVESAHRAGPHSGAGVEGKPFRLETPWRGPAEPDLGSFRGTLHVNGRTIQFEIYERRGPVSGPD